MSYRNYVRIKTYRALKKFQCFIHIFDLVYPQLAPSYIVKVKLLLLHMHACNITPFLNFHFSLFHWLHETLTFALFSKAVDSLDF